MATTTLEKPQLEHKIDLYVTKNYASFKYLRGNRPLDKGHVIKLKNKIEAEGNLTSEFPINVNENLEVIDGQHRVEALRQLGYPVYYTISKNSGIQTVREINVFRRNWNWLDYAHSFAQEGNVHYKDLLEFHSVYPQFGQYTLARYCNNGKVFEYSTYQSGGFKVIDRGYTFGRLRELSELAEVLPFRASQSFCAAVYDVLTNPDYDHKQMVAKLAKHGTQLHEWIRRKDWLRNLEDIYNFGVAEEKRVRFF